jgi:hypothetical protein
MKECTKHRDAVVRYGPYHAECPLCAEPERSGDPLTEELLEEIDNLKSELTEAYAEIDKAMAHARRAEQKPPVSA